MYNNLLHIHSWLRWAFLLAALYPIVRSFYGMMYGKQFTKQDNTAATILLALAHTMLLLGIILFFLSPTIQGALEQGMSAIMKDPTLRPLVIEHPACMIISVALIQIGRIKSKSAYEDRVKHRRTYMYYGIALIIILSMIPWESAPLMRGV